MQKPQSCEGNEGSLSYFYTAFNFVRMPLVFVLSSFLRLSVSWQLTQHEGEAAEKEKLLVIAWLMKKDRRT